MDVSTEVGGRLRVTEILRPRPSVSAPSAAMPPLTMGGRRLPSVRLNLSFRLVLLYLFLCRLYIWPPGDSVRQTTPRWRRAYSVVWRSVVWSSVVWTLAAVSPAVPSPQGGHLAAGGFICPVFLFVPPSSGVAGCGGGFDYRFIPHRPQTESAVWSDLSGVCTLTLLSSSC